MRPDTLVERDTGSGRDRLIVLGALLAIVAFSWWWVVSVSRQMHASPMDAAAVAGMAGMLSSDPELLSYLGSTFIMWALMMVAMMLPSAFPMILLYASFKKRTDPRHAILHSLLFAGCYIAIWLCFSAVASLLQAGFVASGVIGGMAMGFGSDKFAAFLLVMAALYQVSTIKRACLAQCRSPLFFLTRYWRPGRNGAIRIGIRNGVFCLGCCWLLMLLLFAGGVMNLLWVALLALAVGIEKLAPPHFRVEKMLAALCLAGAAVLLLF